MMFVSTTHHSSQSCTSPLLPSKQKVSEIDQANCIIVSQSYQLSKEEQELLARQSLLGIPVYSDQYIIDAVRYDGHIDANQYRLPFVSSNDMNGANGNGHPKQNLVSSVEMKGSREIEFSNDLPKILYTLTWKHKYDVRITAHENIFKQKAEEIKKELFMCLVLGSSFTIPQYVGNGRSAKKGTETIAISSLQKVSDSEIVIRFGINSTYCSKRFGYEPFRLCINFAPNGSGPEMSSFTVYTSEFKTFVKKNANINKYLEGATMDETVKIITPTHNPESLPFKPVSDPSNPNPETTTTKETPPQDSGSNPKKRKRKSGTTTKSKKKKEDAVGSIISTTAKQSKNMKSELSSTAVTASGVPHIADLAYNSNSTSSLVRSDSGHSYSSSNSYAHPPLTKTIHQPQPMEHSELRWFGEPIGMNVNGDLFYLAFWKNGEIFRVNDFVYLCPDTLHYSEINWICKIINLVQTTSGEMKLVGQWYYKWCDVEGIVNEERSVLDLKADVQGPVNSQLVMQHNANNSREVFASFDMTYNPLGQIRAKCYVRWMGVLEDQWIQKPDHYFFYLGFNRASKQLIMLDEQTRKELCESTNSDVEPNPLDLQQELLTLQSELKGHQHNKHDVNAPQHMRILSLTRRPSWEGTPGNDLYLPSYSPSTSLINTPHQSNNLSSLPSMGFSSLSTPQGYPNEHQYPALNSPWS
eukprot:CAMPEP_0117442636 /NCGR_PEP_ID=MMETSP0759-20121206/4259_1 /TAXON_ID=63605 /ORGANISM="Percolomonas cosmopolitus, Strain WS" /LENGTH=695 /DNA_ID=CAMNT_0005234541 /DNA_START=328 /DNA_END=2416 /DNA_ORIENTATION=+